MTPVSTIETNFFIKHMHADGMTLYVSSNADPESTDSVAVSFLVLNLSNLSEAK